MSSRRQVRRVAVQALYLLDAGADPVVDELLEDLTESPGDGRTHRDGVELAVAAWAEHAIADPLIEAQTPEWPINRQPVVDRSILRLAYHEMTSGVTPPKVAINEAVELAKEFSTERSPMFINGVLDKLYRDLRDAGTLPEPEAATNDA